MENYHLSKHTASWKESMINRLSNLINRNRSAAKISQVLCSSNHTPPERDKGQESPKKLAPDNTPIDSVQNHFRSNCKQVQGRTALCNRSEPKRVRRWEIHGRGHSTPV